MKSKSWVFTIIILFMSLTIIFSYFINKNYYGLKGNELYTYQKRDWIRNGNFVKKVGYENIVVLGNSTTTCGFLPNIFDNISKNTNTINLSIPSHGANRQVYVLQDFINHNYVPDTIFWNLTGASELNHTLNGGFIESIKLYNKTNNYEFILGRFFPSLNRRIILSAIKQIYYNKKIDQKRLESMRKERGSFYWGDWHNSLGKNYTSLKFDDNKMSNIFKKTEEKNKNALLDFLEITKKYNIKVILIMPAKIVKFNKPFKDVPPLLKMILQDFKNVTLSVNWNKAYFPSELFNDPGHLNYRGAIEYTKFVQLDHKLALKK